MTPIELISTFRKKIQIWTLIALLVLLAILVMSVVSGIPKNTLVDLEYILIGFSILLAFYVYVRRVKLLVIFKNKPEQIVTELEEYLERKNIWLNKSRMIIFVIMGILIAITLFVAFSSSHETNIANVVVIWAAAITFFAIDGWIMMKDRMMLQDLKHALRENYSETS